MIGSVLSTGVAGIQTGLANAEQAGQKIAEANIPEKPVNVEEALSDLTSAQNQVQASAKVVEAGSQTIGSIVDIKV
ncbi:hypothetical protein [Gynuella sp.]|uniref:hypothetical protein n=1 Tax=Gynuella sp. TaxID=2969146 RepID=UPI003D14D299